VPLFSEEDENSVLSHGSAKSQQQQKTSRSLIPHFSSRPNAITAGPSLPPPTDHCSLISETSSHKNVSSSSLLASFLTTKLFNKSRRNSYPIPRAHSHLALNPIRLKSFKMKKERKLLEISSSRSNVGNSGGGLEASFHELSTGSSDDVSYVTSSSISSIGSRLFQCPSPYIFKCLIKPKKKLALRNETSTSTRRSALPDKSTICYHRDDNNITEMGHNEEGAHNLTLSDNESTSDDDVSDNFEEEEYSDDVSFDSCSTRSSLSAGMPSIPEEKPLNFQQSKSKQE